MTIGLFFSITSFITGVYLLVLSFELYKPKFKTDEKKIKFDKYFDKNKNILKVLSIIMLVQGVLNIIPSGNANNNQLIDKNKQWTKEDITNLQLSLMNSMKEDALNMPDATRIFCDSCANLISRNMSYYEYIELMKKGSDDQRKVIFPIVYYQVEKFNKIKDSVKKAKGSFESLPTQ